MALLLEVKDVHVSFLADAGPVRVLNGAGLSLRAGESLGVVGESGSGKTVLVRTILGLLQPPWQVLEGSVIFNGEDLLKKKEEELRHIRGKEIALTSPEPRKHLNPLLRVGDQIANVLQAHRDVAARTDRQPESESCSILSPESGPRFASRVLLSRNDSSGSPLSGLRSIEVAQGRL